MCYGVHGGAIKHPKGAAAFELQEESKDRKYRFVVKRLMKANQRQGDEPPGLQTLCGAGHKSMHKSRHPIVPRPGCHAAHAPTWTLHWVGETTVYGLYTVCVRVCSLRM